jgi:hypothetical protein
VELISRPKMLWSLAVPIWYVIDYLSLHRKFTLSRYLVFLGGHSSGSVAHAEKCHRHYCTFSDTEHPRCSAAGMTKAHGQLLSRKYECRF